VPRHTKESNAQKGKRKSDTFDKTDRDDSQSKKSKTTKKAAGTKEKAAKKGQDKDSTRKDKDKGSSDKNKSTKNNDSASGTKNTVPRDLTSTRLSDLQKTRLISQNSSIWVGLPRGQKANRSAHISHLDEFTRQALKQTPGLVDLSKVASAYVVVTYSTTAERDSALSKLQGLTFRVNSEPVTFIATKFGESDDKSGLIWHIPAHGHSGKDIENALIVTFKAEGKRCPSFEAKKRLTQGTPDGVWVIRWEDLPHRLKQIKSPLDSSILLATTDGKNSCKLCFNSGHNSWNCTSTANLTLSHRPEDHHKFVAPPPSAVGKETEKEVESVDPLPEENSVPGDSDDEELPDAEGASEPPKKTKPRKKERKRKADSSGGT
jgi:hypothetical protein